MFFKFENEIVDLLLQPVVQDNFRSIKLQELLYNVRHEVHIEQIKDTIQILLKVIEELDKFREWKIRGIERDKCWLARNDFKTSFVSVCKRIYSCITSSLRFSILWKDVNVYAFPFIFIHI